MAYKPIKKIISTIVPLDLDNVDTDQIIPARFLKATSRDADFGRKLFADWRYSSEGEEIADFPLNKYSKDSKILLAGDNFGCGSSREHAAWAIFDYGFRVVMARSFADIFRSNAFNNGILVISVSDDLYVKLSKIIREHPETEVEVDLPSQYISFEKSGERYKFDINPFRSQCLQEGSDLVDFLVARSNQITRFEQKTFSS